MDYLTEIIEGCKSGKRKYQEKLYKIFSKKMYAVCLRYTKNKEEAEDIVHDGFIKIFKKISSYKFKGSFEGWMKRVMINIAIERYHKRNHLYLVSDIYETNSNIAINEGIENISAKELLDYIQELSVKYRTVFNLYAIDGYSHKEIAEMLNISESTSRSNLSRARKMLKEKIMDSTLVNEYKGRIIC